MGESRTDFLGCSTSASARTRAGCGNGTRARNLALLRRIALDLARADTTLKASLKGKRKYDGWDNTFMAALIAG
jgi:hypothetical protein